MRMCMPEEREEFGTAKISNCVMQKHAAAGSAAGGMAPSAVSAAAAAVMPAEVPLPIHVLNIDPHTWCALNVQAPPQGAGGRALKKFKGVSAVSVPSSATITPSASCANLSASDTALVMQHDSMEQRLAMTESVQRMYMALVMAELREDALVKQQKRKLAEQQQQQATVSTTEHNNNNDSSLTSPDNTVVFFDFDDTLMPTSYFERNEVSTADGVLPIQFNDPDEPKQRSLLAALDDVIVSVLRECATLGHVMIVTNAGQGWVEYASSKYLPKLHAYLTKTRMDVISARARYSSTIPLDAASEWKVLCFQDELERLCSRQSKVNMLVLGDSISDQYAAHRSFSSLEDGSLLKFVKFTEKPKPSQLLRQLRVLKDNLANLVCHRGSFDVNVTKDV